ncbi:MAG: MFS transporter [Patescibacteria group bacterium]
MLSSLARLPFLPHHRVSGITALFVSSTLHSFALSLAGIFVPLYILQLTGRLETVFMFFAIRSVAIVATAVPAAHLVSRLGFRRSSMTGTFLYLLMIFLLILGTQQPAYLWLAAIASGVAVPAYWLPYHLIFAEDGAREHFGREVSLLNILSRVGTAAGPLIGGLLILFFGFSALYLATFIILFFSVIPLSLMEHHPIHRAPSLRQLKDYLFSRVGRVWAVSFCLPQVETLILDVVWPVFVFLSVRSYETTGGIASATLLVSILVLVVSSQIVDRADKKKLMAVGGFFSSMGWLALALAKSNGGIFILSTFLKGVRIFYYIPFETIFYSKVAQEKLNHSLTFLVFREMILHSVGALAMFGLWLLILLGWSLNLTFLIAALAILLSIRFVRKLGV